MNSLLPHYRILLRLFIEITVIGPFPAGKHIKQIKAFRFKVKFQEATALGRSSYERQVRPGNHNFLGAVVIKVFLSTSTQLLLS